MARKPHPALRTNKPPPRRRPPPRWSPKQVYAWTVLFTAIVLALHIRRWGTSRGEAWWA
ncbi:hypothetical protein P171DRAFT_427111 [Karstenula rhodostoma CBS 690.94]|uniref:Uncharacterized protein n=1 Tax=Karstenula rhodostoma CBS 690.94 TaxID=1392251 RepID=A0A9P4PV18_9PLEO|nr:hypothetical protein P171DRAFT_427111 [Karstenula rhodostoma CBS 690.94]